MSPYVKSVEIRSQAGEFTEVTVTFLIHPLVNVSEVMRDPGVHQHVRDALEPRRPANLDRPELKRLL